VSVIWHDLECGGYVADLPLWRSLAAEHGDPVLDIGAGTGRVALDLAQQGHRVTALDNDSELVEELLRRARGLAVDAVLADARNFELGRGYALCLVPMQTVQLLGGSGGRIAFLRRARRHLEPGGVVAIALNESLETYEVRDGSPAPLPDICEVDDVVYASHPMAVRVEVGRFALVRRREIVNPSGDRAVAENVILLDRLTVEALEKEAALVGLRPVGRTTIAATSDYVGSSVVMLGD